MFELKSKAIYNDKTSKNVKNVSVYDFMNGKEQKVFDYLQDKVYKYFEQKGDTTIETIVDNMAWYLRNGAVRYTINDVTENYNIKTVNYYPLETAIDILNKYGKPNGNYFDGSAGWGNRLFASIKTNHNYYACEPNVELTNKLKEMYNFFYNTINDNPFCSYELPKCEISNDGSEVLNQNLIGNMDICFTCPPYYDIEIYETNNPNQSISKFNSYDLWLNDFLFKSIDNMISYLKDGGHIVLTLGTMVNDRNTANDVREYLDKSNLKFVDIFENERQRGKNFEETLVYQK